MLVAHLVPGYFAAVKSRSRWSPRWNRGQRAVLWATALASTCAPDLDVIRNALFRGFINHSTLWTHSLFVHLGIVLIWWLLRRAGRWLFLQTLVGLAAIGGLSHLALDVASHGTPLFYPVSLVMVGFPPIRVLEGGLWAYLTDPIVLAEPVLLTAAAAYWIFDRRVSLRVRRLAWGMLAIGLVAFTITFLILMPTLQKVVADWL